MPTRRPLWGIGEKTVKWIRTGAVALSAVVALFTLTARFLPYSAEPKYFRLEIAQHPPDPLDTEFIFTNIAKHTLKDVTGTPKYSAQFCPPAGTSLPQVREEYCGKINRVRKFGDAQPQETAVLKLMNSGHPKSIVHWVSGQLCLQVSFQTASGQEEQQDFGAFFTRAEKSNSWVVRSSLCTEVFPTLETPPECERICTEFTNSLQKSSQ